MTSSDAAAFPPPPEGPFNQWYISCDHGVEVNPASFGLWGRKDAVWYRVKGSLRLEARAAPDDGRERRAALRSYGRRPIAAVIVGSVGCELPETPREWLERLPGGQRRAQRHPPHALAQVRQARAVRHRLPARRSSSMSGIRRSGATPCARSTTMPWTTCAICPDGAAQPGPAACTAIRRRRSGRAAVGKVVHARHCTADLCCGCSQIKAKALSRRSRAVAISGRQLRFRRWLSHDTVEHRADIAPPKWRTSSRCALSATVGLAPPCNGAFTIFDGGLYGLGASPGVGQPGPYHGVNEIKGA